MTEKKKVNDFDAMDIPDFVEDKTATESTSIDMSIFKMTDDELYDDVPKNETSSISNPSPKKKSNSTLVLCLVLCGILLVTSVVSIIYAFKQHSVVADLEASLAQTQAQINDYKVLVDTKDTQIAELNSKIEEMSTAGTTSDPNNKYPKGTTLFVTEDGGSAAVTSSTNSDDKTEHTLYWGDSFTLTQDAAKDSSGNYWGKIDKYYSKQDGKDVSVDGYVRIEWNGEIWASTEQQ